MRKWLMGTIGAAALGLLSLAGGAQAAPVSQPAHAPSMHSSIEDARWVTRCHYRHHRHYRRHRRAERVCRRVWR
jgi:hypothetical protein